MRETQDLFFDQTYWQPAERFANQLGVTTPLGMAVVYDSLVFTTVSYMVRLSLFAIALTNKSVPSTQWAKKYG
jgi:hypothetical protein